MLKNIRPRTDVRCHFSKVKLAECKVVIHGVAKSQTRLSD